jgi:type II secretory ATPase GspE/PulE/Tfp pilus assembly ATPase PilB-like protein
MAPAIVSRLKILADLDIAERRRPQDGKITLKRKGIQEFELRISTMPTVGRFEDAVLRILTSSGTLKLDEIGLNERNLSVLEKIIVRPYGLILCVGPTGSGKTTTLHSALAHINTPGVKIWTAEDPVEITQAGLRQVQVKPKIGLDFAKIMRGFLRLDPDIIMIGEMRDRETAATAIEASLTGHLVLSTLHTNNAPETLTRLLDMGMNPLNIADAFLGVLAQRLVRRLCPMYRTL